jgi:WXG100 family type VII secretion target
MQIIIPDNELRQAAGQFTDASDSLGTSLEKIDRAISALEKSWSGATQQVFYRKYKDLHLAMEGMNALLRNIANEMNVMADRMNEIDTADQPRG